MKRFFISLLILNQFLDGIEVIEDFLHFLLSYFLKRAGLEASSRHPALAAVLVDHPQTDVEGRGLGGLQWIVVRDRTLLTPDSMAVPCHNMTFTL